MIFVVWRFRRIMLWLGVLCVIWGGLALFTQHGVQKSLNLPVSATQPAVEAEPLPNQPPDYTTFLSTYLHTTAQAVQTGDTTTLTEFFDTSVSSGRWAFEQHVRRVNYMSTWAAQRGVNFTQYRLEYRVVGTSDRNSAIRLQINESTGYTYVYVDDHARTNNNFGIGARHVIDLVWRDDKWLVRVHWFLDSLDGEVVVPMGIAALSYQLPDRSLQVANSPPLNLSPVELTAANQAWPVATGGSGRYNRTAAVAYADKYCGLALGCGNNGRYNHQYRSYAGLGGDCTNFVSQVLGDAQGGGLRMTASWRYQGKGKGSAGSASAAWVSTDAFAHFLVNSGRATRIMRAGYQQVTKATADQPLGAIGTLKPGDVIGYAEKGDVVHFSVVTALDSRGVPLVNSHTADRYHVPWDLGWERNTSYWLYRIKD